MKGLVRDHLDMLILSVLGRGHAHGYAIAEELKGRSDGAFDLPEGTIYPALYRLERAGRITSTWSEAAGRRRRVYRLTRRGRAALSSKTTEWRALERAVGAVIGKTPWLKKA